MTGEEGRAGLREISRVFNRAPEDVSSFVPLRLRLQFLRVLQKEDRAHFLHYSPLPRSYVVFVAVTLHVSTRHILLTS